MKSSQDLEERLREHLASERASIDVPPDLEATVLRALEQPEVDTGTSRGGITRQVLLAAALLLFALGLGFGISRLHAINRGPITPSPTAVPSATSTASPTPTPLPISLPRPATQDEYAAMVAAGKPGAEQRLGIADCGASSPGPGHDCFMALPASDAIVGSQAGYFHGARFGAGCWVYLFEDGSGWHFSDVQCGQAPGTLPRIGLDDTVNVSGCANLRAQPSLTAPILTCVPNGTTVRLVGGPAYRDGHLWWMAQQGGWMVHESLVSAS